MIVRLSTTASIAVATVTFAGVAAQANPCKEFGQPSFTATRTIAYPDKALKGKVWVNGDRFREEMVEGNRTIIRMGDAQKNYTYDEVSQRGIVVPAPPMQKGEAPDKSDPSTRVDRVKTDTQQTFTVEKKRGEEWTLLLKVVCRLDGVLLEQVFPVQIKDREVMATLTHTDIQVGPIPEDRFRIPSHIRLVEPPKMKQN